MAGALVESGEVGAAELGVSCVLVGWPVPADALRTCCSIETCSNGMNAGDQEDGSRDDRGEGEARHGVRQRRCTAVEGRETEPETCVAIQSGAYLRGCPTTKRDKGVSARTRAGL